MILMLLRGGDLGGYLNFGLAGVILGLSLDIGELLLVLFGLWLR